MNTGDQNSTGNRHAATQFERGFNPCPTSQHYWLLGH